MPVFAAAHVVSLLVRLVAGGMFPGWSLLLSPLFEAALWPLMTVLLPMARTTLRRMSPVMCEADPCGPRSAPTAT